MVASILHGPQSALIQQAWHEWLKQHGVDSQDPAATIRFLGQKCWRGRIQATYLVEGLAQLIHWSQ